METGSESETQGSLPTGFEDGGGAHSPGTQQPPETGEHFLPQSLRRESIDSVLLDSNPVKACLHF